MNGNPIKAGHLSYKAMSKKQRSRYIYQQLVKDMDASTLNYLRTYTTTRCKDFISLHASAVAGKTPLDINELRKLLDEVRQERKFRGIA